MPTSGELFAKAMESTQSIVDRVRPEQMGDPTPCSEWTVRDIINHVTGENLWATELFAGKTMAEVGDQLEGDLLGGDPQAAFRRSVASGKPAVMAKGAMEMTCDLSFGPTPGFEYANQLFLDMLIHGWDIAKATEQNTHLDPELVSACLPLAERARAEFGEYGVFGNDLSADAGADDQARLLALLGRQA